MERHVNSCNETTDLTSDLCSGFQEQMMKDKLRTITFRNAMYHNRHLIKDKIVLDIGCGTGILCLFAVKAGARKVIGIDCSNIIEQAKRIVKANNLSDKISLVKGKVEEIVLPNGIEKVDIIIGEWLGLCLFYESMLSSLLFARDKWLKRGGIMMPDKATFYVSAAVDVTYADEQLTWWTDVDSFEMSCVKEFAVAETLFENIKPSQTVSTYCLVKEINIMEMKIEDFTFSTHFSLKMRRDDSINVLVIHFDMEFMSLNNTNVFVSGLNHNEGSHWKQQVIHIDTITVKAGDEMTGILSLKPNENNQRDMDISVRVRMNGSAGRIDNIYKYTMR